MVQKVLLSPPKPPKNHTFSGKYHEKMQKNLVVSNKSSTFAAFKLNSIDGM